MYLKVFLYDLIYLITIQVEHAFMCLLAIFVSFSVKFLLYILFIYVLSCLFVIDLLEFFMYSLICIGYM